MVAQFTAKTTNSEKAIKFLSLMSCSRNKHSVDFRIDHGCPVHANTNDHTSCTINHESNIEENESLLDRFRYAANQRPVIDKSLENEFYYIIFCWLEVKWTSTHSNYIKSNQNFKFFKKDFLKTVFKIAISWQVQVIK